MGEHVVRVYSMSMSVLVCVHGFPSSLPFNHVIFEDVDGSSFFRWVCNLSLHVLVLFPKTYTMYIDV